MIKAVGEGRDGAPLYLLGLSDRNLELLRAGKPILVNLRELNGIGHVCICWGETEESLAKQILGTFTVAKVVDMKNPNG